MNYCEKKKLSYAAFETLHKEFIINHLAIYIDPTRNLIANDHSIYNFAACN